MSAKEKKQQIEEELRELFAVIKGEAPADLALYNVKIVDVYAGDCYEGSLLVHKGRIAALNPDEATIALAKERYDGRGMYALPGFIDGHMHIDTELVTPKELAEVISPFGTTAVVAEFLDVASASGEMALKSVKCLFQNHEALLFRLYLEAPGKKVNPDVIAELLAWEDVFALGEFNHFKFCAATPDTLAQLAEAKLQGKMLLSHARYANNPQEFNLFPAAGSMAGHDAFSYEDLLLDLRAGQLTMLRQGYGVLQNVSRIMPEVIEKNLSTDHLGVCTDGLALEYLMEAGHMNSIIQTVIDMGMNPVQAIRLATLNTAQGLHLERDIGSLTPGRFADVVLVEDIQNLRRPVAVFKDGRLVAKDGKLVCKLDGFDYSPLRTSRGPGLGGLRIEELTTQALDVSPDGKQQLIRVFNENTPGVYDWYEDVWLDVEDAKPVLPQDMSRLWVIQRYPSGKRHIISTFTRDYAVKQGGFAITNQSPAPYIAVVGRNEADMWQAVQEVDKHPGGYAVCIGGALKGSLQLPLAGVISDLPAEAFAKEANNLKQLGQESGFVDPMGWFRELMMLFWKLDRNSKLQL